jgi:hypothetical protein
MAGFYIYGNQDKDVSDYLKAFIFGEDVMVVGLIGDGTSMELVSKRSVTRTAT